MEDIQFSNSIGPPSININDSNNEFINAEETKTATDAANASNAAEGDVVSAMELPEKIVEVVIEKNEVLEPEDPVLPDHYYDDGNIPVFKPVFSNVGLQS